MPGITSFNIMLDGATPLAARIRPTVGDMPNSGPGESKHGANLQIDLSAGIGGPLHSLYLMLTDEQLDELYALIGAYFLSRGEHGEHGAVYTPGYEGGYTQYEAHK